jgi:hypothetical protein
MAYCDLLWRGPASLPEVHAALARGDRIVLVLPQALHHALAVRLSADAASVDVSGDPEILRSLAALRGLEALGDLVGPLRAARYSVSVTSPEPLLRLAPAA